MRDDFQFNIQFCEEVQRYSNLYDQRRSDYCNRSAQDQAWEKISQKFNGSVTECKDRWKNIRGSYSKYKTKIKTKSGQGTKHVKEYYLAPHLLFLDPFLKSRKSKGNMDEESEAEEEAELNDNEASNCSAKILCSDNSLLSIAPSHSSLPSPSTTSDIQPVGKISETPVPKRDDFRKRKKLTASATSINDVNFQAYQYFEKKQQLLEIQNATKTSIAVDSPDPDLAFLHSVLPDIKCMNSSNQKLSFKMGILNLIEKIYTTPEASTLRTSQSGNAESANTSSKLQGNTPKPPAVNVPQERDSEFIRYNTEH